MAAGAEARKQPGRDTGDGENAMREPAVFGGERVSGTESQLTLGLLRGFELVDHDRQGQVHLPLSAQRVLAFLALHDRPLQRMYVAGSLWLDVSQACANASLRTAIWRLRRPNRRLVDATPTHVAISRTVHVDVHQAKVAAEVVLEGGSLLTDESAATLCRAGEILPDWYEDWVLIEREHFRQLRLHALEVLCEELTADGRFADAIIAGLAAVEGEPLRESAHRALIKAHISEGNPGEALRQYAYFHRLLSEQLGLEPSKSMSDVMSALPVGYDVRVMSSGHATRGDETRANRPPQSAYLDRDRQFRFAQR
jgi:DNA-binding SARP family transcriptional activator